MTREVVSPGESTSTNRRTRSAQPARTAAAPLRTTASRASKPDAGGEEEVLVIGLHGPALREDHDVAGLEHGDRPQSNLTPATSGPLLT